MDHITLLIITSQYPLISDSARPHPFSFWLFLLAQVSKKTLVKITLSISKQKSPF